MGPSKRLTIKVNTDPAHHENMVRESPVTLQSGSAVSETPMPVLRSLDVSVEIRPTEDKERMIVAVEGLFPGIGLVEYPGPRDGHTVLTGSVTGAGAVVVAFRNGVRRSAIADAVATHMTGSGVTTDDGWKTTFHLSKQAAMVGKLHLGDDSGSLRDIRVCMEFGSEPGRPALVEWFNAVRDGDVAPGGDMGGGNSE